MSMSRFRQGRRRAWRGQPQPAFRQARPECLVFGVDSRRRQLTALFGLRAIFSGLITCSLWCLSRAAHHKPQRIAAMTMEVREKLSAKLETEKIKRLDFMTLPRLKG
jgi:hypothetical protein